MKMIPTEAQEQETVVGYCDLKGIPCFHIPNGGSRHRAEAVNLKRQGVKPGVPDLCIPVAKGGYHGLYIEMKRTANWSISKLQEDWIGLLKDNGYAAYVCPGADNAIRCIESYMSMK